VQFAHITANVTTSAPGPALSNGVITGAIAKGEGLEAMAALEAQRFLEK